MECSQTSVNAINAGWLPGLTCPGGACFDKSLSVKKQIFSNRLDFALTFLGLMYHLKELL